MSDLGMFREVEVKPEMNGEAMIILSNRLKAAAVRLGVRQIKLCMAHSKNQTCALVILED